MFTSTRIAPIGASSATCSARELCWWSRIATSRTILCTRVAVGSARASATAAIAAGMLVGPAQVGARIIEASWLSRFHPMFSLRLACLAHPVGATLLAVIGGAFPAVFVILHGAGGTETATAILRDLALLDRAVTSQS